MLGPEVTLTLTLLPYRMPGLPVMMFSSSLVYFFSSWLMRERLAPSTEYISLEEGIGRKAGP